MPSERPARPRSSNSKKRPYQAQRVVDVAYLERDVIDPDQACHVRLRISAGRRPSSSSTRPCGRAWPSGSRRAPAPSRHPRGSDARHEVLGRLTPKRLASTAPSALIFISPKPGSAGQVGAQLRRSRRRRSRPARRRRRSCRGCGRRGPGPGWAIEPGKRWMAGRSRNTGSRSVVGQRGRVERAHPLAERQRPGETPSARHLLVEREADQQRHRIRGDQRVGLVGLGEVQAVGHRPIITGAYRRPYGPSSGVHARLERLASPPGPLGSQEACQL